MADSTEPPSQQLKIHSYNDISSLEREICRLLRCEEGRTPAHATTVSYFRFRSRVIQMLSHILDKENIDPAEPSGHSQSAKIYLPQGLSVRCSMGASCVLASIEWVRGSCVFDGDHGLMKGKACEKNTERERKKMRNLL
jgi:hypothetical protein